jgi:hypothetical protein
MREKGGRGKGEENRSPSPLPDTRMPASSLGDRMAVWIFWMPIAQKERVVVEKPFETGGTKPTNAISKMARHTKAGYSFDIL